MSMPADKHANAGEPNEFKGTCHGVRVGDLLTMLLEVIAAASDATAIPRHTHRLKTYGGTWAQCKV
jgi:hypothetical protein